MDLHESNTSGATGKKRGTSGWVKPKYYSKHREWLGKVCEKTTGYTLTDYADNIEATITSNDYRTLYKHFYSADADGNLKDSLAKDEDTESTEDLEGINEGRIADWKAKIKNGAIKFLRGLKGEGKDTKKALEVLYKYSQNKKVSVSERKFVVNQLKDTLKMTFGGAVIAFPFGVAILAFLVKLAKKIGVDLRPDKFRD